jgi:hypothetical protein
MLTAGVIDLSFRATVDARDARLRAELRRDTMRLIAVGGGLRRSDVLASPIVRAQYSPHSYRTRPIYRFPML